MRKKLVNSIRIYFLIFLALVVLATWSTYLQEPDNNLHIYALDVGQGDALLVQKKNFQIIIDGGPDNTVVERLAEVMPLEDKNIEVMILTHPHADHVTGLVEILKRYNVEKVIHSGIDYQSNIFEEFKKEIELKKIPVENPPIGRKITYQETIRLTYLWPGESAKTYSDNINNTSEVIRLDFGSNSAIFSGDCETECWSGIMQNSTVNLKADLLKVSHHGSSNGTPEVIIPKIKPKFAIISLGKNNKYGFPHKQVTEILEGTGISYFRTDMIGTIDFILDGERLRTVM